MVSVGRGRPRSERRGVWVDVGMRVSVAGSGDEITGLVGEDTDDHAGRRDEKLAVTGWHDDHGVVGDAHLFVACRRRHLCRRLCRSRNEDGDVLVGLIDAAQNARGGGVGVHQAAGLAAHDPRARPSGVTSSGSSTEN